jgi:hypothetical protein
VPRCVDRGDVETVAQDRLTGAGDQAGRPRAQTTAVAHEQEGSAGDGGHRRPQDAGHLAEEKGAIEDAVRRRLCGEDQLHGGAFS